MLCAHRGGLAPPRGGLKMSSTTSRVASPTRASNRTPNRNSCPKVDTSSPLSPYSKPRQSLSFRGMGVRDASYSA